MFMKIQIHVMALTLALRRTEFQIRAADVPHVDSNGFFTLPRELLENQSIDPFLQQGTSDFLWLAIIMGREDLPNEGQNWKFKVM